MSAADKKMLKAAAAAALQGASRGDDIRTFFLGAVGLRNDGVIVATYVTHSRSGFLKDLSVDNFFLATGETLTITAEASDTTDEVAVALSWFEDQ